MSSLVKYALFGLAAATPIYMDVQVLANGTVLPADLAAATKIHLKRQGGGNTPGCAPNAGLVIELVDGGSPHTVHYNKQISETITCSADTDANCSTGVGKEHSIEIGFEAGGQSGSDGLFTGGLSVSESWSESTTLECGRANGNGETTTACIWYDTAFTEYTVHSRLSSGACGTTSDWGEPYTIKAPNNNNADGIGAYCVYNTCRKNGDGYWA